MNIIEAYIKFKKQFLIFITGISGCGKTALARNISRDFKLKMIDQFDYYKKGYSESVDLPDGTKVINWYNDDAVDWDKLNKDIDEMKDKGLIVAGFALPTDKLTNVPDYHIHLNISKQECIERRRIYVEKNKDKYEDEFKLINTPAEKLKMNQLIFPYYLDAIKRSKIQKFINITELNDDAIYDQTFETIISFIQKVLYQDIPAVDKNIQQQRQQQSKQQSRQQSKQQQQSQQQSRQQESKQIKPVKPLSDFVEQLITSSTAALTQDVARQDDSSEIEYIEDPLNLINQPEFRELIDNSSEVSDSNTSTKMRNGPIKFLSDFEEM